MNILDIFFGTSQSKYAAFAIFSAIIAVCLLILFNSTDISISKRLTIVFFIILASIPSILFTLFELTCLVTGGTKKSNWWCYYFAWIIAFILIVYSIIVIISVFISLFTYNNAVSRLNDTENSKKLSQTDANNYAKSVVESYVDTPDASHHSAHPIHPDSPAPQTASQTVAPSASQTVAPAPSASTDISSANTPSAYGSSMTHSTYGSDVAPSSVIGASPINESFNNSFGIRYGASESMPLISENKSQIESFSALDSSYASFQK